MLYYIGRAMCRVILRTLGWRETIGSKRMPKEGGVILAPNHVSYLDPPLVGSGISRQVHFMAKQELFDIPVFGFLIRAVGAFPVKRGTADRGALKKALELLNEGRVVCIFPEGARSQDNNLQPPELGFAMIALKSRVPVVPTALVGTERSLSPKSPFFRFGRIKIMYGNPMTFEDLYDKSGRESLEEVGRRVMEAIGQLRAELQTNQSASD